MAKDIANGTATLVQTVKSLDGAMTEENRRRCGEAAKPLLHALEMLGTFTASPEYAGVPATISDKGRTAQLPITTATRALLDGAIGMIDAAKLLAANPRDPATHHMYAAQTHTLSEAVKSVVSAIRDGAPGQRECDAALHSIDSWINLLDQASLAAVGQNLIPTQDGSLSGYQEQVMASARQLLNQIEPLREAAKGQKENLDHYVLTAAGYMEPLTTAAIGCASRTVNSKLQMNLLDQSKTVIESMQSLMMAVKSAAGNKKMPVETFSAVDEMADGAKETLQELIETLETAAASSGLVASLVHNLTQAISKVAADSSTDHGSSFIDATDVPSYVDCQTSIVKLSKQIVQTVQEMASKSVTNVQDLGALANTLTHNYNKLAAESCRISLACPSTQVSIRIKSAVQQLGTSCIELVQDAGSLQSNPNAGYARRDMTVHSRKAIENVSEVMLTVQSGSRGTQACINAAGAIDGIIADLDTTIMFATAGTLNPEPGETFANHRDGILQTARQLVDSAKLLVAGAASNQEQLMTAAGNVSAIIAQVADSVKRGASALGSHQPDAQIMLINAAKDVASALSLMIDSAKNASGKSPSDPSMNSLKESAKVVVINVTSLLKTVKSVEDEAARGTQALESSIEAISQEMRAMTATDRSEQKITPDDLVRLTRPITLATARAVAAGNSGHQDDIIAAANMGRKAVSDLLRGCRSSLVGVSDPTLLQKVQESGSKCGASYRELLRQIHLIVQGSSSPDCKQKLAVMSKDVAAAVAEIVQSIDSIRGSDWVDPCDPTVIAENELLSAANSIEAAAKKLAQLQPRQRPRQADESLNFEEQILEAAKSIAAATAALVKAASVAQRELVEQGKIGAIKADLDEDSQWSQGLISAAKLVAVATHSLCDAANAMVQGQASEEKLISSSKQVAASTAQLLLACKVKADPNSKAMQRLQTAGNAVKRATEALVREAQTRTNSSASGGRLDDDDTDGLASGTPTGSRRMVSDMAQVIKAQEEILRKERELEAARQKLKHIRMAQYQPASGSDTP
jgi:talin